MPGNNLPVVVDDFERQLNIFTNLGLAEEKADSLTNITGMYSQLTKRVFRRANGNHIQYREFKGPDGPIEYSVSAAIIPITKMVNGVSVKSDVIRNPSIREDRVEDALAYLASQGAAVPKKDKLQIGVTFTLQGIRTVIMDIFDTKYSVAQIRESLNTLARSSIDLPMMAQNSDAATHSNVNTRISNLTLITAQMYRADRESKSYCEFHWAFARDIALGDYCAHDIELQGKLNEDLAIDLIKTLSYKFRQAGHKTQYNFAARKYLENSCIGFYEKNPSKSWGKLKMALEDLKKNNVIRAYNIENKTAKVSGLGGRTKIEDRIVTVWAHKDFTGRVKTKHWLDDARGLKEMKKAKKWSPGKLPKPDKAMEPETDEIQFA